MWWAPFGSLLGCKLLRSIGAWRHANALMMKNEVDQWFIYYDCCWVGRKHFRFWILSQMWTEMDLWMSESCSNRRRTKLIFARRIRNWVFGESFIVCRAIKMKWVKGGNSTWAREDSEFDAQRGKVLSRQIALSGSTSDGRPYSLFSDWVLLLQIFSIHLELVLIHGNTKI